MNYALKMAEIMAAPCPVGDYCSPSGPSPDDGLYIVYDFII